MKGVLRRTPFDPRVLRGSESRDLLSWGVLRRTPQTPARSAGVDPASLAAPVYSNGY
jgi:hypothetical protein